MFAVFLLEKYEMLLTAETVTRYVEKQQKTDQSKSVNYCKLASAPEVFCIGVRFCISSWEP